jgi:acyl-CoA synthetase (AMP-forming)/AMP-acid ligase II
MNHQELSPILFLERAKKNFPNDTVVVTKKQSYSYKKFYDISIQLAFFLQKNGIQYGDKIAIIAPNSLTLLLAHYAIPIIGCILVPINHKLKINSILHILKNSDSKVLIAKNNYIDNDIIIYGCEKISSIEVETILMKHPFVELAAVLPLKDNIWGEVHQAVVQLRQNS